MPPSAAFRANVESEIILVVCLDEVTLLVDVGSTFAFDWAVAGVAARKASRPNAAAYVAILIIILPPCRCRSEAHQCARIASNFYNISYCDICVNPLRCECPALVAGA